MKEYGPDIFMVAINNKPRSQDEKIDQIVYD